MNLNIQYIAAGVKSRQYFQDKKYWQIISNKLNFILIYSRIKVSIDQKLIWKGTLTFRCMGRPNEYRKRNDITVQSLIQKIDLAEENMLSERHNASLQ